MNSLSSLFMSVGAVTKSHVEYKKKFGEIATMNKTTLDHLIIENERLRSRLGLLEQNVATLEAALGYNPPKTEQKEAQIPLPLPESEQQKEVEHGLQSDQSRSEPEPRATFGLSGNLRQPSENASRDSATAYIGRRR